jgi:uncharacterized protein YeaO (DUF488 family)
MTIHVVRLGTPPVCGRLRLGTVRRPPRGVPKAEYAARGIFDVWLPTLAPSDALLKSARARDTGDERAWRAFARAYRREMQRPDARATLALLAALSQRDELEVGCYCADEARCHRSILRELLADHGALLDESVDPHASRERRAPAPPGAPWLRPVPRPAPSARRTRSGSACRAPRSRTTP